MSRGPRTAAHRFADGLPADAAVEVGRAGVVVGFDVDGNPVSVQLFRDRPTHVVTVCSGYTARLLAFRSLAVGAAVEVSAAAEAPWQPLLELYPAGSVLPVAPGAPAPAAGPRRPLLRCDEVPPEAASPWSGLAAWQTRIVVPSALPPATVAGLTAFDLVLLRRLAPDSVYPVQLAFNLPNDLAAQLPRLPDDCVAALVDGEAILLNLGLTPVESAVLGPPWL